MAHNSEVLEKHIERVTHLEKKIGPFNETERQFVATLIESKALEGEANPEATLKDILTDIRAGKKSDWRFDENFPSSEPPHYSYQDHIKDFAVGLWIPVFIKSLLLVAMLALIPFAIIHLLRKRKTAKKNV